jgi:hypothetical protein
LLLRHSVPSRAAASFLTACCRCMQKYNTCVRVRASKRPPRIPARAEEIDHNGTSKRKLTGSVQTLPFLILHAHTIS